VDGAVRITVNGNPMDVDDGLSLERLLERLQVRREYTAVALNREVAPRSAYSRTLLRDGDRVEIVHPMGGG
jgi:thiamine biosynthesis protein ThiS